MQTGISSYQTHGDMTSPWQSPWGTTLSSMFSGPHPLFGESDSLRKKLSVAEQTIMELRAQLDAKDQKISKMKKERGDGKYFREVRKSKSRRGREKMTVTIGDCR